MRQNVRILRFSMDVTIEGRMEYGAGSMTWPQKKRRVEFRLDYNEGSRT